jgi:hypothetical protein
MIYEISLDKKYITAFKVDANGAPTGMPVVYTQATLAAKIAQLNAGSAVMTAQATDLTANALPLFTV